MASDGELDVSINLRKQINNLDLTDEEFSTKTTASKSRINAWMLTQTEHNEKKTVANVAGRSFNTITGDKIVNGSPARLLDVIPEEDDAAGDNTDAPAGSRAPDQRRGFDEDVDIREVAPWLYQDEVDAEVSAWAPKTAASTPPGSYGRASTVSGHAQSVTQALRTDEDNEPLVVGSPNNSVTTTPKTSSSGDRKSSFKDLFSPSPTLRKISSKISLSNLRRPSLRAESSFPSETNSPLTRSFQSVNAGLDSDSSSSTIGCAPYEDLSFGPAPRTRDTSFEPIARTNDSTPNPSPRNEVTPTKPVFRPNFITRKPISRTEEPLRRPGPSIEDIDSVRARRGFRPLSVITDAVNYSIDPFPHMDLGDHPPVIDEEQLSSKLEYHHELPNTSSETVILASRQTAPMTEDSPSSDECANASPSLEEFPMTIHSDASTLFNTPPPLLADHPLYRDAEDPFEIKTAYPLMNTSTPAPDIKALAKDMNLLSTRSATFADDLRKKKSYRNLGGLLTKSASATRTVYGPETTPPSLTRTSTFESGSSKGKGLRKLSNLFNRSTKGAADSPTAEKVPELPNKKSKNINKPEEKHSLAQAIVEKSKSQKNKNKNGSDLLSSPTDADMRDYMERWVRNHLNYHRKDYKPGVWPHFPPHPNTGLAWDHANLRCTTCVENYCGCCGKTCCAYRAMTLRLSLLPAGSDDARSHTEELAGLIAQLYPTPQEQPTFLQCTECKKMTCPECCGVCPVEGCGDTECRKCKDGDAWNACSWH